MSETVQIAIIGIVGTLLAPVVSLICNYFIERYKIKELEKRDKFETKREKLTDIYKELINIINLYPNLSPNDILNDIENAPNYSMESFDSVMKSLDYQIEDYTKQLKNLNIHREQENNISIQVSNIKYAKNKIFKIKNQYIIAKEQYASFLKTDKIIFDLYAGQDVRSQLVEFEVLMHNIFVSGRKTMDKEPYTDNLIENCKRKLINTVRSDIGINI
jgi:hypothetical protein